MKFDKRMKAGWGKLLFFAAAVAGIMLLSTAGYLYIRMLQMNRNAVRIVDKPVSNTAPPSESLEPLPGIPEDIGKDFHIILPSSKQDPIYKQVAIDEDVMNILFVCCDARSSQSGSGRADSMILLSYDRFDQKAKLVSFMRDIWVPIPGHGHNRLNAAHSFGGVGLCVNTINDVFQLDIQHYIAVDFKGFMKIIDDLGGISMDLSADEVTYINKKSGSSLVETNGIQELSGMQALCHSRNREMGDGDFGRTLRQGKVIRAIFEKLRKFEGVSDLTVLLMNNLENVQTNIAPDVLFTLGLEIAKANDFSSIQSRVPFDHTWYYANKDGRSVIAMNVSRNREMLRKILYGTE